MRDRRSFHLTKMAIAVDARLSVLRKQLAEAQRSVVQLSDALRAEEALRGALDNDLDRVGTGGRGDHVEAS